MSTIERPPTTAGRAGLRPLVWHRPLLWLTAAMAALAVVSAIGIVVDPRELVGAPAWAKPLKFALSIGLYTATLSWLIGMLPTRRRLGWWIGTVTAVCLLVEIVVIVGAVVTGTTSHFNVSTPFHAVVWEVMAVSIGIVWMAALPVAVLLFRARLGDRARTLAIRSGFVVGLIGMALAFLMTIPGADQITNYQGIVGAHTVGLPDGGPGLPLLGWSTVAGDLRIPHFVGMHALQLIPLSALVLELMARGVAALRDEVTRRNVVVVVIALYCSVLALLTAQALSGESIVRPGPVVVAVASALFAAAAVAIAIIIRRSPTRSPARPRGRAGAFPGRT